MKRGMRWLSALLTVAMLATGTTGFALAEATGDTEAGATPIVVTETAGGDGADASAPTGAEVTPLTGADGEGAGETPPDTGEGSTGDGETALNALMLSAAALELEVGQVGSLTVAPNAGATLGEVSWSSSDGTVAAVSGAGANATVSAVAAGSATITVSCGGISASCAVTVREKQQAATGAVISGGDAVYCGETLTFALAVEPQGAAVLGVNWSVSDASVATIDGGGVLTPVKPGSVSVQAVVTTLDGQSVTSNAISVTVWRHTTGIALSETGLTLDLDQTAALKATLTPADATDAVEWRSSDENVARVDANGSVTAVGVGEATITVSSNGHSAACQVRVERFPRAIELYSRTMTLAPGEQGAIRLSVLPADTTKPQLTWTTSDANVATVNGDGVVTGVNVGECAITATTVNGVSAVCSVRIVKQGQSIASIKLNKTTLKLVRTKTYQLKATLSPSKAADRSVIWLSSNPEVAAASASGKVTAMKAGTAVITAMASNGMYRTCVVTVSPLAVSSVKLNKRSASLSLGGSVQLSAKVSPANADDAAVIWSSSNPAAVTVDENGLATAVGGGKATITARTANGKKSTCTISVKGISIKLNKRSASLSLGGSVQLKATISQTSEAYSKIVWTSSNPNAVTVDENGFVTAVGGGSATITAQSYTGNKATCKVTVKSISIKLNKRSASLSLGGTMQLQATISQTSEAYSKIVWTSSNPNAVMVDENGFVTAVGGGSATITAQSYTGNKATCKVTVKGISIKLNRRSATLLHGSTGQLQATISQTSEAYSKVTWASSNPAVVAVDENGLITGVAVGSATITAQSYTGSKATCKVTVKPVYVTGIALEGPGEALISGGAYQLKATCAPENASNTALSWKSSNTAVIRVDANTGAITCLKAGTATITATAKDGSKKKATIQLTVEAIDPQLFVLNIGEATIKAGETCQATATLSGILADKPVEWSTGDARIAVVDANGLITGIGSGTTAISARVSGNVRQVRVTVQANTDVNYRVLVAGEYTSASQSGYLKFANNGLNAVISAFEESNIDGARYDVMKLNNPSEALLLNTIRDFFSGAKEGDVSVLYLMSHGTNTNGEYRWKIAGSTAYITEQELTRVLEGINGNVVLNICSCYAGEYINDYCTATSDATSNIMNVVSTVNAYRPGNSKISIIAANTGYLDSCYTDNSADQSFDFFTRAFNEALGWNQEGKQEYGDGPHADADGDGKVTLLELASYVKDKVKTDILDYVATNGANSVKNSTAQDPQYYLTAPDLVVYARAKAQ